MTGSADGQAEWVHLSTVEAMFLIGGRGVVVAPGIPAASEEPKAPWTLRTGDAVRLERPDGTKLETTVRGLEFISTRNLPRDAPRARERPILLGPDLTKDMVPVGTKLWIRASTSP